MLTLLFNQTAAQSRTGIDFAFSQSLADGGAASSGFSETIDGGTPSSSFMDTIDGGAPAGSAFGSLSETTSGSSLHPRTATDSVVRAPSDAVVAKVTRVRATKDRSFVNLTGATNPDFDSPSIAGWSSTPGTTHNYEPTFGYVGPGSLHLVQAAPYTANDYDYYGNFSGLLVPGRQYRITAYAYVPYLNLAYNNIAMYVQTGAGDVWTWFAPVQVGQWVEHSVVFTAAYNIVNLFMCVRGEVYWDAFSVREEESVSRIRNLPRSGVAEGAPASDSVAHSVTPGAANLSRTATDTITLPIDTATRPGATSLTATDTIALPVDQAVSGSFVRSRSPLDGAGPQAGVNWIVNPNAEGATFPGLTAAGASIAKVAVSDPHSGSNVINVAVTATDQGVYQFSVDSGGVVKYFPADTVATLSSWVKAPAGTSLKIMSNSFRQAGGWQPVSQTQPFTATGAWQQVSTTLTDTAAFAAVLMVYSNQAGSFSYYVDDLSITAFVRASDAATRSTGITRVAPAQTLPTLIDTATRGQLGSIRTPSDNGTVTSDVATKGGGSFRTASELLVTPFEVTGSSVNHFRNMAENPTQAVTDNFGWSGGLFNRNPNDLAGAADTQLIPGQTLYRTDNVEDIPTVEDTLSPSTHSRTNFLGDSAPATDIVKGYGGNIRFGFDGANGRNDVADGLRIAHGTASFTRVVTATFAPRGAGSIVWHRSAIESAPVSGDSAVRPPFNRVRTATDNIPLQGESNVKPQIHNFVLSGDEEILFRGDVFNVQYKLKRTSFEAISIRAEQAAWHQVKIGSATRTQPVTAAFVQPRVFQQSRPQTENLRAQFAETLSRVFRPARMSVEYAANSTAPRLRTTLIGRPVQPTFSRVQFLGITDTLTFAKVNGRLGIETLPVATDVMTQRRMVGTRVVNDFVTGLNDNVVRNALPRSRSGIDTALATDAPIAVVRKTRGVTDFTTLSDGYLIYARHLRGVAEFLPTADDGNGSQQLLQRNVTENLVPISIGIDGGSASSSFTGTSDGGSASSSYGVAVLDVADRSVLNRRTLFDAASAADVSRINRQGRNAVDTYPTSDSATVTTLHQINQTATDLIVNGSDAVVSLVRVFRSFTESAPTTDGGSTRQDRLSRSLTENVAVISDTATRLALALARTGFDIGLVAPADSVVRLERPIRTLADTAPMSSEATVSWSAHFRSFTETIYQGEVLTTGARQFPRSLVDAAQGFDSPATRTINPTPRTGVDAVLITDAVARVFRPQRFPVETATAIDTPSTLRAVALTGTDSVPVTDAATKLRRSIKTATDSTNLSEIVSRFVRFGRTASDVVFGSDDSQRPSQVYFRPAGPDYAPASEFAAASYHGFPRVLTDNAPYTGDLAVRSAALKLRNISEPIPTTEVAIRGSLHTARPAADTVPVPVDVSGRQWGAFLRSGVETIPIVSEADIPPGHRAIVVLADTVTGLATVQRVIHTWRTASDTVPSVFDTTVAPQYLLRPLVESLSAANAVPVRLYGAVRNSVEDIPTIEVLNRAAGMFWRYPVDMIILLGDINASARNLGRFVTDTIPSGSQTATRGGGRYGRASIDVLAVPYDACSPQSPRNRSLIDSASAADALTRSGRSYRYSIDAVPVIDGISNTNQGIRRSASDSAHFSFEMLYSNTVAVRYLIDVAPATDIWFRLLNLTRVSSDDTPATEHADRSGRFSSWLIDTIIGGDVGGRMIRAIRSAADVAPSSAIGMGVRLYRRFAIESMPTSDRLTVQRFLRRAGIDVQALADFAYRLLDRVRYGLDLAHAVDHGISFRSRTMPTADTASSADVTGRKTFKIRYGRDVLPSAYFPLDVDQTTRWSRSIRSRTESAPASDQVRRIWQYLSATADFAPVSDGYTRKTSKIRYGLDVLSSGSSGTRIFRGFRADGQVAHAADGLRQDTLRGRNVIEIVPLYEHPDSSRVRPPKPYGPPEVTITSISRQKLSLEADRNLSVATFEFDRPVDSWVVRVGSRNAFDGTLLDSWSGPDTYTGLAMIDGSALRPGRNEIAVYGRSSASGEWTRSVAPDLASV